MKWILISVLIFSSFVLQAQDVFEAARQGDLQKMESLYGSSPNILNAANKEGYTPLMLAAYYGHDEMATYLVNNGADLNGLSKFGTPVMAASVKKNKEIVSLLLEKGADPNIQDSHGKTALLHTAIFGFDEISEMLLKAGADKSLKDETGNNALDYAILRQNEKLIKLLSTYQ